MDPQKNVLVDPRSRPSSSNKNILVDPRAMGTPGMSPSMVDVGQSPSILAVKDEPDTANPSRNDPARDAVGSTKLSKREVRASSRDAAEADSARMGRASSRDAAGADSARMGRASSRDAAGADSARMGRATSTRPLSARSSRVSSRPANQQNSGPESGTLRNGDSADSSPSASSSRTRQNMFSGGKKVKMEEIEHEREPSIHSASIT